MIHAKGRFDMPENEVEESRWDLPEEDVPDLTEIMLQKTPWWAISTAFHIVVLLILWKLTFGIGGPRPAEVELVAKLEKKEEPEYDPEKPRDIVKKNPLADVESDIDAPVIETEMEFDDHFETDDDMLTETARGFENATGLEDAGSIGVIGGPGGRGRGKYGFRTGGGKKKAVMRGGGGKATESAVDAGLRWLARHQASDGGWHTNTWHQECPSDDSCVGCGGGRANDMIGKDNTTAVTGFAILAFLGAGHTHQAGKFRGTVKDGLGYLIRSQGADGKFGPGDMYTHGIACLAAVEAYGMTRTKGCQKMAQRGINYIVRTQNPLGGWNYVSPSSRNDMSITGWQIMALKSAMVGGLNVPEETVQRAIRWFDIATRESDGSVCYAITGDSPGAEYPGGGGSIRMRAAGMLCHLFFGKDRTAHIMTASGEEFLRNLPVWRPHVRAGTGTETGTIYRERAPTQVELRGEGDWVVRQEAVWKVVGFRDVERLVKAPTPDDPYRQIQKTVKVPIRERTGGTRGVRRWVSRGGGVRRVTTTAPSVPGVDLYYWYYATLVNFQLGDRYWGGWNTAMKKALLPNQIRGRIHADGSWPPIDLYSDSWSRPGMTALCVLSLEVYYRYLPIYMK